MGGGGLGTDMWKPVCLASLSVLCIHSPAVCPLPGLQKGPWIDFSCPQNSPGTEFRSSPHSAGREVPAVPAAHYGHLSGEVPDFSSSPIVSPLCRASRLDEGSPSRKGRWGSHVLTHQQEGCVLQSSFQNPL